MSFLGVLFRHVMKEVLISMTYISFSISEVWFCSFIFSWVGWLLSVPVLGLLVLSCHGLLVRKCRFVLLYFSEMVVNLGVRVLIFLDFSYHGLLIRKCHSCWEWPLLFFSLVCLCSWFDVNVVVITCDVLAVTCLVTCFYCATLGKPFCSTGIFQ